VFVNVLDSVLALHKGLRIINTNLHGHCSSIVWWVLACRY